MYSNPEAKLVDMLLKNSNPNAKPFYGNYEPIEVWLDFVLGRISDMVSCYGDQFDIPCDISCYGA